VLEACARAEALKVSITHSRHIQLSIHTAINPDETKRSKISNVSSNKSATAAFDESKRSKMSNNSSRHSVSFDFDLKEEVRQEVVQEVLPTRETEPIEIEEPEEALAEIAYPIPVIEQENHDASKQQPAKEYEAPLKEEPEQINNIPSSTSVLSKKSTSDSDDIEKQQQTQTLGQEQKTPKRHLPRNDYSFRIHDRTYEISELCRMFMGRRLRNFFTLTTCGDLYGITWTFAAIFGSSLADNFPIGTSFDYQLYILIFSLITIPVSCMRIVAQITFQYIFLVGRTIMIILMLGTLIGAYVSNESHFDTQPSAAKETPLADFSNIVTVLQLCVFSTAFQFSVPGLTAETGDKRAMKSIISKSVIYIYITNLILGLAVSIYFGANTEASSNLNWLHYHGGTWDGVGEFQSVWWAKAISSYIVLFAALDGLAVYPLIAVSLGDILMGARYEDNVHLIQDDWKIRVTYRLTAAIPQAVGALFVKDLGVM
jgi:hypothetical protein